MRIRSGRATGFSALDRVDVGPACGDLEFLDSDLQVVEQVRGNLVDASNEVAKRLDPVKFLIGLPSLSGLEPR